MANIRENTKNGKVVSYRFTAWTLLRFGKIHVSRRHLPVRAGCFPDEGRVGTEVVQIPSAGLACEICGGGRISVVIGRGLGAAGSASALARTSGNIAMELHQLLERLPP